MIRQTVCGMDEAGRGSLAGPIVGAGVILAAPGEEIEKIAGVPLRDGKTLSPSQREQLFDAIQYTGSLIRIEIISVRQINSKGIGWANRELFRRIVRAMYAHHYIADGTIRIGRFRQYRDIVSIPKADSTVPEVIAAGIAAKVSRDRIMKTLSVTFPHYLWHKNAGYGTAGHIHAIGQFGTTVHHRNQFVSTALKTYAAKSEAVQNPAKRV